MWLWIGIVAFALLVAVLLTKIRLRVEWGDTDRTVFVGLGRTGGEFDFITKLGQIRLFGFKIKTFLIKKTGRDEKAVSAEKAAAKETAKKKPSKKKRVRPIRVWLDVLPGGVSALWKYGAGLFRSVQVERARGEIVAGFDSPDLTGQLFGYYQAVSAAVPRLAHIRYTPVWNEQYFSGAVSFAAGVPVYRLAGQTLLLLWRLPITRLVKLIIGKKEGAQDERQ